MNLAELLAMGLTLDQAKKMYQRILDTSKTENRALTAVETADLDTLKVEIGKLETASAQNQGNAAAAQEAIEQRSAAAAAAGGSQPAKPFDQDKNTYLRNIAKGSADVGNKEIIDDVVRQYNLTSPIFAAHQNVQKRSTGMSYSFTQISPGAGVGYAKTEAAAGTSDTTTVANIVTIGFKTYSSQKVLVTQEALDDYAADVSQEVLTLGLAKSTLAFGADAITAMKTPFLVSTTFTPTETAATTWAMDDIVACYHEIPVRNRYGVKFTCNGTTRAALISLLTNVNAPQAAAIGLSPENIIEDDAMPDDVLFIGNITLVLAIGMKLPVRTVVLDVSEGKTFEVQPRLAVGLRDGTAIACRKLKAA